MWGYNPRVKDDPNKYNRCRHAISCEKDVRRGGKIVRVRENYTDHAVDFFSKSKNKTTKYTVNKAHTQDGARAEAKAQGEAKADAAAARAAEARKAAEESENRHSVWGSIKGWAKNSNDWWGGQNVSLLLGIGSVAVGIVGIALVATGVGAPAGLALAGLALGGASALIDCSAAFDASCKFGIAGFALGAGGFGSAMKAAKYGWSAAIPSTNTSSADNIANLGVTLDMSAAFAGTMGAGATGVSRATGWDW